MGQPQNNQHNAAGLALFGPFGSLLKSLLVGVEIRFDPEARAVNITRKEETKSVTFDELEKFFNNTQ
jgi:hypothetical protein